MDFVHILGMLPYGKGWPQLGGKPFGEPGVFSIRDFLENGKGGQDAGGMGAKANVGTPTHGNDAGQPAGDPGQHGHGASHR